MNYKNRSKKWKKKLYSDVILIELKKIKKQFSNVIIRVDFGSELKIFNEDTVIVIVDIDLLNEDDKYNFKSLIQKFVFNITDYFKFLDIKVLYKEELMKILYSKVEYLLKI